MFMAGVNANYEFIMVDVGASSRISYEDVFKNSTFGSKLKNNTLICHNLQI